MAKKNGNPANGLPAGSPERYLYETGHRPVLDEYPRDFLSGPFFLDVAIANGGLTAVDCTVGDAWYGDAQARACYGATDGGTGRMQATLHLEAVALMIVDGAFSVLAPTTKDNLWLSGKLYVNLTVAGAPFQIPLEHAISEEIQVVNRIEAAAAASTGTQIRGRPFVLASPLNVNLNQDTFQVVSSADVALGAATQARLVLWGALIPNSANLGSLAPSSSCAVGGDSSSDPAMYRSATGYSRQVAAISF